MSTWYDGTSAGRTGSQLERAISGVAVVPTAFTNAAVTAAIAVLDGPGIVRMPPGEYTFTDTVHVPNGVHIIAYGAYITHTSDSPAFSLRHSDAFSVQQRGSVRGFVLSGNSGSSAIGVDIGNSWAAAVMDAYIAGYTAGRAIRLFNETNWTEGTFLSNLMLRSNAVGIELVRDGGTDSFAYQRWHHVNISVPGDGIGIDLGGDGDPIYLYNSDLDVTCWLEGNNATAVLVRATANCPHNRYRITGEGIGSYTGRVGIDNLGGTLSGIGSVSIDDIDNTLDSGSTTQIFPIMVPLDSTGGADGSSVYQRLATTNPQVGHNGQFGFITDSGLDVAYVGGYGGGDEVFRVVSVGFGDEPSDGDMQLAVKSDGRVMLHSGAFVQTGTGTPEGAVAAPVGSLFLRTDGSTSTTLYVKTSGSGNTGWTAK